MNLIKLWNKNFNKGVTTFQMFLGLAMILGASQNNQFLIMFSMFSFLFAYLEPNTPRFALDKKGERR